MTAELSAADAAHSKPGWTDVMRDATIVIVELRLKPDSTQKRCLAQVARKFEFCCTVPIAQGANTRNRPHARNLYSKVCATNKMGTIPSPWHTVT